MNPNAAAAMLLVVMSSGASACDLPADAKDSGRIDAADGTSIAWRVDPDPLRVDTHFALQIRACAPLPIAALAVDAQMPDHRHGMNYKPTVVKASHDGWHAQAR